jgi:hypothetical protein
MKFMWACAAILCGTLLAAGGCGQTMERPADPMTVTVVGGASFPNALAGRWTADQDGWEFVFEPDGRIASIVLSLGRVTVFPGQTTTVSTVDSGEAVFTPGPWAVHYETDTRMLTVKLNMEHIHIPMDENVLEGSSTDIFSGLLSDDLSTWRVEWTTFTRYKAHIGELMSLNLSTDETYGETKSLLFERTRD